ncbi:hypothetical protein GCM10008107_18990 [Psychrosphaera saromensis]|uniref:Lipoprotein n=1 Tax=Psychrosphaera saromensis TaxID=716813 RepID=A0A2S7USX1_9GAMM|nr:hypothetical protein [Psychrosphaera saromensis]PQJ52612.1 hypothetical protein BTO11_02380 [Psychrosphaera saromensis]GHB69839.1 hypothetical protein GCM10008107_18990 [Psychrosphaera saromensis]GLQ13084.1 hypothetical protein GCM10007917_05390 [Psychrosphaera saromensis]
MKILSILCLTSLVAVGVSACQTESNITDAVAADSYTKNTTTYQKQGSAVSLLNSKVSLAEAGVPYLIDLAIDSKYSSGDMEIKVSASDGLSIVSGTTEINARLSNGVTTFPFEVSATEVGRYYLYAVVKTQSNGMKSGRALTLIVQVGEEEKSIKSTPVKTKKKGANQTDDAPTFGAPVVLPANEEII